MNSLSLRLPSRRVGYIAAAFVLLFTTLLSSFASAAQVTERSIALSTSAKNADGVTYNVKFTAIEAAGAFTVYFCNESPLIGDDCTTPTGFSAAGAASASAGVTAVAGAAGKVSVETGITADEDIDVVLTGINNPTDAGTVYARIVTFDTQANATTQDDDGADSVDAGGVALSFTETVAVSGAVLESLTFCVSGATISAGCTGTTAPVLRLGQDLGNGTTALSTTLSTGDIYTQIATNASGGAVVRLKSSALNCGGLKLQGSQDVNNCFIAAAGTAGTIADGQAKFGVKAVAGADTGTSPTGVLQAANNYNGTDYRMNGVTDNTSGVTSTYGDEILNTNNAPANGKNTVLTFAAAVTDNTPAGLYSADLSLIATGKF